ncbi:hypothetical protein LCGC14_3124270, partial [marine sediment metagenome]
IATIDADLKEVAKINELKHLELWACSKITNTGLAYIAKMKHLEQLSLSSSVTDEGPRHVANLTTLKELSLYLCNQITDDGLAHLAKLKNLNFLLLPKGAAITDAGLAHISELNKLTSLFLYDCDSITDAGLAHIAKIKGLRSLYLSGYITDVGLQHLTELPELSTLGIGKHGTMSDEMAAKLRTARPRLEIWREAVCPPRNSSSTKPLEFSKNISLDMEANAGGYDHESYTSEGKWIQGTGKGIQGRGDYSCSGHTFKPKSIRFNKTLFLRKLSATIPIAIRPNTSWQLTLRLLDSEGEVLKEKISVIEGDDFFHGKKKEIVLSLGRWSGYITKATDFELL